MVTTFGDWVLPFAFVQRMRSVLSFKGAMHYVYEVQFKYILQPGLAALTEGVRQLQAILARAFGCEPLEGLGPVERTRIWPVKISAFRS
jgi:hypothetical protein